METLRHTRDMRARVRRESLPEGLLAEEPDVSRLTRLRAPDEEKRPYKACGKAAPRRPVARFDLRYARGEQWEGMLIDYLKLRPIEYTGHQRILLPTTEYLITLQGVWLDALLDALQDEQIRFLQQFHPWYFHTPPEGDPIIQEIHITPRHGDLALPHHA
jgi:hypothetical protein